MKMLLHSLAVIVLSMTLVLNASGQLYENSVLWEITGKNLPEPSYLFGTIRFIPKDQFEITKRTKEKLKACKILATEVVVDHHTQHELNLAAHLPDNGSIEDLLTPEEYQLVKSFFITSLGISEMKFNLTYRHLKPVVLNVAMTRLHLRDQVKYYDQEVRKLAKKYKLESLGLETIEREIDALDHYPLDKQAEALVHNVQNFETHYDDFEALVDYYKEGNLDQILGVALRPMEGNPEFKRNFFDKRSSEWVPTMEMKMDIAPTFFALGVAHFGGSNGLIQKLKDRGYTLTPISVN